MEYLAIDNPPFEVQPDIPITFIKMHLIDVKESETRRRRIQFELPYAAQVEVRLLNVYGTEVDQLMNDWKNSGTHYLECTHNTLPPGIYVYQVKTNYDTALRTLLIT